MLTRAEVEAMLAKCGTMAKPNDFTRLARDWLALEAVVSKLPRTADGVLITPGMNVWRSDTVYPGRVHSVGSPTLNVGTMNSPIPWCPDYCYSKESLAVAAREAAALAKNGGK